MNLKRNFKKSFNDLKSKVHMLKLIRFVFETVAPYLEKMVDISSWDLAEVKKDLIVANRECSQRRLLHSAKWYII